MARLGYYLRIQIMLLTIGGREPCYDNGVFFLYDFETILSSCLASICTYVCARTCPILDTVVQREVPSEAVYSSVVAAGGEAHGQKKNLGHVALTTTTGAG